MITMGGTQHQQPVAGVCWLAELAFAAGTVRCATWAHDLTVGGYTWQGLGALASVAAVSESSDSGTDQISLSLSLEQPRHLALCRAGRIRYQQLAVAGDQAAPRIGLTTASVGTVAQYTAHSAVNAARLANCEPR